MIALLALGWWIARDIGRIAGPTFFRRMDPATAGTVGFLIRLATMAITLVIALQCRRRECRGAGRRKRVHGGGDRARGAADARQPDRRHGAADAPGRSASASGSGSRPGAIGGQIEGVVSSLGLLYTTLAHGDDRIMIPNSVVLAAVVVPLTRARVGRRQGPAGLGRAAQPGAGAARRPDLDADATRPRCCSRRSTARTWSSVSRRRPSGPATGPSWRTRSSPRSPAVTGEHRR